jgi:hypothetical protein
LFQGCPANPPIVDDPAHGASQQDEEAEHQEAGAVAIDWAKSQPKKKAPEGPLSITQAPANSYEMLDRGIIATWFANERGMPAVWSPWHVVLNTN